MRIVWAVACAAALLALTSCSQADSTDDVLKKTALLEVTTARSVDSAMRFADGDTLEDNIWTGIFAEQYGLKVINLWTVDTLQYNRKLSVAIASGQLPDFFLVSKDEMKRLYENGQIEDLSGVLKSCGSGSLKDVLAKDGGISLKSATIDGKLTGLPKMMVNGGISTAEMVWVRTDWLHRLGLPEPKTIDDVVRIANAFAHGDPDGNGKADTVGLGVNKELFMYHGSLKGFFNGYGAYPEIWITAPDGKLVYGSIQPEVKKALSRLAEMYRDGSIDGEFMVKPWTKLADEIAEGKLGLAYGTVSDGGYIQKENRARDHRAEWGAYPLVSESGEMPSPQLLDPADSYYVVRKGAAHPEALIRLANSYLRYFYETDYSPDQNPFASDVNGVFPARYHPVAIDPMDVNLAAFRRVQAALATGSGNGLVFPASLHYERLSRFYSGDEEMWFSSEVFGPEGSYSVIDQYDQQVQGIYNAYQGLSTASMLERLSALLRLQDDVFTQIIMGELPIDAFEEFVSDWRRLGGDAMTMEVNEAIARGESAYE